MRILLWWATNLVALWAASRLVAGISYDDFWALAVAALVFGIVNFVVRPLVILLALPAVVLTLGLALLLVNALMLVLTGLVAPGFDVKDFFWAAVLGALIVWAVNVVLDAIVRGARLRR